MKIMTVLIQHLGLLQLMNEDSKNIVLSIGHLSAVLETAFSVTPTATLYANLLMGPLY